MISTDIWAWLTCEVYDDTSYTWFKIFGLYHSGEVSFCTNGVSIDHAVSYQCMSNIIFSSAFLYYVLPII